MCVRDLIYKVECLLLLLSRFKPHVTSNVSDSSMRVHIMGVLTPVGLLGQQENLRLLHVLHTSLGFKAS